MITDDSVVDAGGFEDPHGLKFGRFVGIRIVLAKLVNKIQSWCFSNICSNSSQSRYCMQTAVNVYILF